MDINWNRHCYRSCNGTWRDLVLFQNTFCGSLYKDGIHAFLKTEKAWHQGESEAQKFANKWNKELQRTQQSCGWTCNEEHCVSGRAQLF